MTLGPTGESELRFEWAEGDLEAEKILRFRAPGYLVRVAVEVQQGGRPLPAKVALGAGSRQPDGGRDGGPGLSRAPGRLLTPRGAWSACRAGQDRAPCTR